THTILFLVLNAIWQAVVLFVIGLGLARIFRKAPAHFEYLTWCAVLASAALTPWLSLTPFSFGRASLHRWTLQPESMTDLSLWFGGNPPAASAHGAVREPRSALFGIAIVYGLFLLVQAARLFWGMVQVHRMVSHSRECTDSRVIRLSARFTRGQAIRILTS